MERVVRKSAAEVVADQLREAIVFGDLEMGATLSEAAIAETLGTSRTPVREAFRALAQEGLVVLRPYSGASVFMLSPGEVRDLLEFRAVLELAALQKAFATGAQGLRATLAPLVAGMSEAVERADIRQYMTLDSQFHRAIVAASGNDHLADAHARISPKVAAIRNLINRAPSRLGNSMAGHQAILNGIAAGDLEGTAAILKQHLHNLTEVVIACLAGAPTLESEPAT
ncbi:MAG: GntR family transcriptional regulator [Burkholderiales bacterium]|nr:GntR family transcriptional regulator [Burkholderiales bacterium]MDE1925569.1 GntR family transcriptional regulator [Burkholderiales bacterium]MDE2157933.1 GntR family transcriptional regulator [Burkholderiales bacterium]MDE2503270.1 GntR family transcriptional regulator [Burkholderiales bacterium]